MLWERLLMARKRCDAFWRGCSRLLEAESAMRSQHHIPAYLGTAPAYPAHAQSGSERFVSVTGDGSLHPSAGTLRPTAGHGR